MARGGLAFSASLNVGGTVVFSGIRAVVMILIGRLEGPSTLGNVQTAFSAANIASLLGPSSMGAAAGRYAAMAKDHQKATAARISRYGLLVSAAAALCTFAISASLGGASLGVATALLALTLCSSSATRGVLVALRTHSVQIFTLDVVSGFVLLAGALLVPIAGLPWQTYLYALAVSHLPAALYAVLTLRDNLRQRLPHDFVRYVAYAVLGSLASAGLLHMTTLFVRFFGDARAAGFLAAGFVMVLPITILSNGVSQVLLPRISVALRDGMEERARMDSHRLIILVSFGVGCVLTFIFQFSPALVPLLFGNDFTRATASLLPLSLGTLAMSARMGAVVLVSATGVRGVRALSLVGYVALVLAAAVWGLVGVGLETDVAVLAATGYGVATVVATSGMAILAHGRGFGLRLCAVLIAWWLVNYGGLLLCEAFDFSLLAALVVSSLVSLGWGAFLVVVLHGERLFKPGASIA